MNISKITTKLALLPIEELSWQSGFVKIESHKIGGLYFVHGFFQMINNGHNTLEKWCEQLYRLSNCLIRKQSLQGKLQFVHVRFCKLLLECVMRQQVLGKATFENGCDLLQSFRRVFIEDSSCVTLPKMLRIFFPGSVNQVGQTSSARIQLRLELNSGHYSHFDLEGYRDNDQKFSPNILKDLLAGDLVIRDLGYWVIGVFRKIDLAGAFFLSRFKYGNTIYEVDDKEQIDLYEALKELDKQGITILDKQVLLGKDDQLPVRLVAIKCSKPVADTRKKKAKKKDSRVQQRSKQYIYLLECTIFVTNVEEQIWEPRHLLKVYGYRWQIEMIFKCWKSKFKFAHLFKNKHSMSPPRAIITFYLLLLYLTCFFVKAYNFFLVAIYKKTNKILSMLKFADYFKQNFQQIILEPEQILAQDLDMLAQYYTQDKRKIKSHLELLYMLNTD